MDQELMDRVWAWLETVNCQLVAVFILFVLFRLFWWGGWIDQLIKAGKKKADD